MKIKVNGLNKKVTDALSSGPGSKIHTYKFIGGYVYEIAGQWFLQLPGQYKTPVNVERG